MAADQEPEIAADGVQEVPLTIARSLLTRMIEQVREQGLISAFTIRRRRRAYLVAPDWYEQAIAALENSERCTVTHHATGSGKTAAMLLERLIGERHDAAPTMDAPDRPDVQHAVGKTVYLIQVEYGLSSEDIAAELGIPAAAVKSLVAAAGAESNT